MKIMVETSARHIHLTQEDLDTLFGEGYQLTPKKDLSQPGQFACVEKVEVVGPKNSIKMSILGPIRPETQVEISKTEARTLGIDAPVRMSADLEVCRPEPGDIHYQAARFHGTCTPVRAFRRHCRYCGDRFHH